MDAIKNLLTRQASGKLTSPIPTSEQMQVVYQAALRAPDHAWLRPWRYLEVRGEGRHKLSKAFLDAAMKDDDSLTDELKQKLENAPFRAPMIIVLVADVKEHPKVPKVEQLLSLGASAQNILLAIDSLGYGAVWRTGKMAFNPYVVEALKLPENSEIIGYLYVGTPTRQGKSIPELNIDDFLTKIK